MQMTVLSGSGGPARKSTTSLQTRPDPGRDVFLPVALADNTSEFRSSLRARVTEDDGDFVIDILVRSPRPTPSHCVSIHDELAKTEDWLIADDGLS